MKEDLVRIALDIINEIGTDKEACIKEMTSREKMNPADAKVVIDYAFYCQDHYGYVPSSPSKEEKTDYDNMSIEELQKEIEKQKLINELKGLKGEQTESQKAAAKAQAEQQAAAARARQQEMAAMAQEIFAPRPDRHLKRCPKCKSTNIELLDDDLKDIKRSTSINVNPLKPFTVFNHKEKEKKKKVRSKKKVAAAILTGGASLLVTGGTKTTVHKKFVCRDCHHTWYEK